MQRAYSMKNFILAGLRCRTQQGKGSKEVSSRSHLARLRLRACPIWDSDDTSSRDDCYLLSRASFGDSIWRCLQLHIYN
jgi:hypothetical protein